MPFRRVFAGYIVIQLRWQLTDAHENIQPHTIFDQSQPLSSAWDGFVGPRMYQSLN